MKGLLSKIRISRKIVLAFGGVLVLCGATGAAAVFIGADKILGPSYADRNGLECTEIKTVTIKKKDHFWVRKYIITDEAGDGLTRVKTALRVAGQVYERDKPDLVQVVVLDKNGPSDRSAMRGRAVGADVVYIADPARVPEEPDGQVFTARYVDKPANADGMFYGEKIALPEAEIEKLVARLDDKTDCIKPEVVLPEGQAAPAVDGHAAPADGHDADQAAPAVAPAEEDAHGADAVRAAAPAPSHALPAGEGVQGADVAPQAAAPDVHAKAAEPADNSGWFSSLKGMVLGNGSEDTSQSAKPTDAADGHEAAPAETAAPAEAAAPAETAAPAEDAVAAQQEDAPAPSAEGKAKSAGAAWLEKLRSKPLEGASAAPAATEMPAEDSDVLPPKASDTASAEKHAQATQ